MTALFNPVRRLLVCAMLATPLAWAQSPSIVVSSTTSTEQSGLFAHLLPAFQQATGIAVKVVALDTGQALDTGRRGDADVLFVHDQEAEEKIVAEGFAVRRYPVMYNDFILVGTAADPAKTHGADVVQALEEIAWWDWPIEKISRHLAVIVSADVEALRACARS